MIPARPSNATAGLVRAAAASLLWSCGPLAQAQTSSLEIEPSALPLSCLMSMKPERTLPQYPADAKPETNAVVRVRLEFASKDQGPVAKVVFNNGPEIFAQSVRDFVADYRLPCLQPERPFSGIQEFQFVARPTRPAVLESAARNAEENALVWPPECLAGIKRAPPVEYPSGWVTGQPAPGLVIVRLTFASPDRAPETAVLFDGGDRRLSDAALKSVAAYRMECMRRDDPPFTALQTFVFRLDREEVARLKPELTLAQLLRLVKGIKEQKVRFDFTTMGCPFKVTLRPYQPYATNTVQQVGERDAGRREFTEWLRNVTLDFPPKLQRTALGEPTTISVPCAVLDLS